MCNLTYGVQFLMHSLITRAFLTLKSVLDLVIQLNGWPVISVNQFWLCQTCVHLLKVTSVVMVLLIYFALLSTCLPVTLAIRKADFLKQIVDPIFSTLYLLNTDGL